MGSIIPLWKSHYSVGRSILTLGEPIKDKDPLDPDSVIQLCTENGIDDLFLVEDSMTGFLEACTNAKSSGLKFNFGLRLTFCEDLSVKNEGSLNTSCKYIIFCKNNTGYERLIKIYSEAAKDGFYYEPRTDFKNLKKHWSNEDLSLAVPFYDSFVFYNNLHSKTCIPDFSFLDPVFFIEDNNLPFDSLLTKLVENYASKELDLSSDSLIKTKSIYYKDKKDFKAYLTFKCINKRTILSKPNIEHMCSDEFCLESWNEKK